MLAIDEFNAAVSGYNRRMATVFGALVFAMFAFMGSVAFCRDALHTFYVGHCGEVMAEILMGLSLAPALPILFVGIWLAERSAKRDRRLYCPACGKRLMDMRHLVVATRNCGHCGKRVMADPDPVD